MLGDVQAMAAAMYKGMKEAVEGVWKRFYEVRKPESEGSNG
jgi:hypothetical protein